MDASIENGSERCVRKWIESLSGCRSLVPPNCFAIFYHIAFSIFIMSFGLLIAVITLYLATEYRGLLKKIVLGGLLFVG